MSFRVIVCGGRDYTDAKLMDKVMCSVWAKHCDLTVIEGGQTGADTLAREWAEKNMVPHETFEADWNRLGKSAGPIRNRHMLEAGAEGVVAFPGGRGTADMVQIAKQRGVPVYHVQNPNQ